MQEHGTNLFQTELFRFLKSKVEKLAEDSGIDSGKDRQLQALLENLSYSVSESSIPLDEIIESYHHFFKASRRIYLEKALLDSFDEGEFSSLGIRRYYPRVYRGLPRLYHRNFPTQSYVKKNFSELPFLKKAAAARAFYSLYSRFKGAGKVVLFTWVINDGLGDYVAAVEIFHLLKAALPFLKIDFVCLINSKRKKGLNLPEGGVFISYDKHCPLSKIPKSTLKSLRNADLILQAPTFYPHFSEMMEKVFSIKSENPRPIVESIGEYGFLESNWFHPKSENHSMGLHFLEKGILMRRPIEGSWEDVENEFLKKTRKPKNHFYLAYLATQIGGAVYLHSLLKSLEEDEKDIDLCVPDLDWFFKYTEKCSKENKPIFQWDLNVSSIEIYFRETFHEMKFGPSGKKVRILCPDLISQKDFRLLLALSGEWVAVRGDQSFSEALSQKKVFFYDGREHARYFIKDLLALAENRIKSYPKALDCVRGMASAFLYNLSIQEEDWVDETFFQTVEEWTVISLKLGLALQEPEMKEGFLKLSQIIAQEKSVNGFFSHLVQRAIAHQRFPDLAKEEKREVESFCTGKKSFGSAFSSLLESCQKRFSME